MAEAVSIDQFELRLRLELEKAEQQLRNATPEEKAEAQLRFKGALHRFTVFIFKGKLEPPRC